MATVEELIGTISQIKVSAEELASMIGQAASGLKQRSGEIAALTQGSRSGAQAVQQVAVAANSLDTATSSLNTLGSECSAFVQEIRK